MINDATAEDAVASGLDHDATIVDTGCCTPGIVLRNATPDFLKLYEEADVVISKGQGGTMRRSAIPQGALFTSC